MATSGGVAPSTLRWCAASNSANSGGIVSPASLIEGSLLAAPGRGSPPPGWPLARPDLLPPPPLPLLPTPRAASCIPPRARSNDSSRCLSASDCQRACSEAASCRASTAIWSSMAPTRSSASAAARRSFISHVSVASAISFSLTPSSSRTAAIAATSAGPPPTPLALRRAVRSSSISSRS